MSNNLEVTRVIAGNSYQQLVSDDELPKKILRALHYNSLSKQARQLLFGGIGFCIAIFLVCVYRGSLVPLSIGHSGLDALWLIAAAISVAISVSLSAWVNSQEATLDNIKKGKYEQLFKP